MVHRHELSRERFLEVDPMVKGRSSVLVILAILLASIALMGAKSGCNKEVKFSHSFHLDMDFTCDLCHGENEAPSRADHDNCLDCHDFEIQAPDERCLKCHLTPESREPIPTRKPETYRSIEFKHAPHTAEDKVACATCHGKLKGKGTSFNFPLMEQCTSCHLEKGAPLTCSTCHDKIRADRRPDSHTTVWMAEHGRQRLKPDHTCVMCHKDDFCASCHMDMKPRSHTQFWRDREHGLKARYSREKCMACHQEDFCISCHETTPPVSHKPGWGEPTLKHCRVCHLPVESTECFACHKRPPPDIFHQP